MPDGLPTSLLVLPVVFVMLAATTLAKAQPAALNLDAGVIRQPWWLTWGSAILLALLALGSAQSAFAAQARIDLIPPAVFAVVLGALALWALLTVPHGHTVAWDAAGLEGPSHWSFTRRGRMGWDEIVRVGESMGAWYAAAADGRRVYWSFQYAGYPSLAAALRRRRPDLALPRDALA